VRSGDSAEEADALSRVGSKNILIPRGRQGELCLVDAGQGFDGRRVHDRVDGRKDTRKNLLEIDARLGRLAIFAAHQSKPGLSLPLRSPRRRGSRPPMRSRSQTCKW
jgi:hypothetical protein